MRILQISNKAPYPANDGSSIAIYTLAEGLADNGANLHLLTINTKKHYKPDSGVPQTFQDKSHYASVYRNTNTSVSGALANLFSAQSYFVSRFYFREFGEKIVQILKAHRFDVVQLEGVFLATYIPLIRQHAQALIAIRAHNVEHQIWDRHLAHEKNLLKKWYLGLQNRRLKRFELEAFSKADAIVTITDDDKSNIQKFVPGKALYTCLTGIRLDAYAPALKPTEAGTLFHFASMDWMPNEEAVSWLMEKVWPEVHRQLPDVKLVLAGKNMPDKFMRLANNSLQVINHVKSSVEFYQTYDLMLVPLWSGSGLRIKLVEGLAYGKAIITTSIGAEGIPYTHGQNLLIADTAEDFIASIVSLLKNPEQRQALQTGARKLAEEQFDYKRIAGGLLNFYEALKAQKQVEP